MNSIEIKNNKKKLKLCERKELIEGVLEAEGSSVHRACKIVCMSRSIYYYAHKKDDQIIISINLRIYNQSILHMYLKLIVERYELKVLCGIKKEHFVYIGLLI